MFIIWWTAQIPSPFQTPSFLSQNCCLFLLVLMLSESLSHFGPYFVNWLQCSFVEHRNYKIVYRRYASLFFLIGVDNEEVSYSISLTCIMVLVDINLMYLRFLIELLVLNDLSTYMMMATIFFMGMIILCFSLGSAIVIVCICILLYLERGTWPWHLFFKIWCLVNFERVLEGVYY